MRFFFFFFFSSRRRHTRLTCDWSSDVCSSDLDDGPGVPPEVRAQLFEPGVSTKPGGWGIGLALARRIVEQQHGGRLVYRPAPTGEGAEFVLEFPLVSPT